MYAVMFYVILNKRKLHFPLAKNVMHSPSLELRRTLRHTSEEAGWTRPRDVCGIIAFQSTGLRECMGKAVLFSAQFHQGASNRIWRNSRTL